jgi:8-oxo-dGTP pyrophosphatase MutT (NUDIX family)
MFKYCPSCSSKKIKFEDDKVFRCPDCGFVYYHNVAAANGCIISVPSAEGERLVFTVRGKDPGKGLLDLPGGFVDPGEGVLDGLYRELREEIGWTPPVPLTAKSGQTKLAEVFNLFASFSNVYKYKGIDYNTCDMYFTISAPDLMREDLCLQEGEIADVLFLKPGQIDFNKFAFESTRRAVKVYLGIKY